MIATFLEVATSPRALIVSVVRGMDLLPLVWLLLGGAIGGILYNVFLLRLPPERRIALLQRLAASVGALTIFAFAGLNLYSLRDYFLYHEEANILTIAAASMHGQPVYHALHSTQYSYAMIYGPLTFLLYRVGLWLGGGGFLTLRLMVVLANFVLCATLYGIFRKYLRPSTSLALVGIALWPLFTQVLYSMGLRADPWIVLAMALAARCCLIERPLPAALLTGLFGGLAIDLKLTVAPCLVLLLLLLYRRAGIKTALLAAVAATVTALLPFTLHGISLPNYLDWLQVTRRETFVASQSAFNAGYVVALLLPFCLLAWFGLRPWKENFRWPELLVLSACLFGAFLISSKAGAGPWHFWQLPPVLAIYLALAVSSAERQQPLQSARAVWMIALASSFVAIGFVHRDASILRLSRMTPGSALAATLNEGRRELAAYSSIYSGHTLQVGYGDREDLDDSETHIAGLRYLPVFEGQPYTLDNNSRMEVIYQPFPVDVLQQMENCKGDVWLIPHDQQPFMNFSFPKELRETFARRYAIQQRAPAWDAWVCKSN